MGLALGVGEVKGVVSAAKPSRLANPIPGPCALELPDLGGQAQGMVFSLCCTQWPSQFSPGLRQPQRWGAVPFILLGLPAQAQL